MSKFKSHKDTVKQSKLSLKQTKGKRLNLNHIETCQKDQTKFSLKYSN